MIKFKFLIDNKYKIKFENYSVGINSPVSISRLPFPYLSVNVFASVDSSWFNLDKLSLLSKAEIYNQDVDSFIKIHLKKKYNILFFDPPFANNNFIDNLKALKEKQAFEKKHVVIIHRESKAKNDFDNICRIISMRKYGRSKIFFGSFN